MGLPCKGDLFYDPLMHIECYEREVEKSKKGRGSGLLQTGIWAKLVVNGFLKGKSCVSCSQVFLDDKGKLIDASFDIDYS